jgi:hypothetical protein
LIFKFKILSLHTIDKKYNLWTDPLITIVYNIPEWEVVSRRC